MIIYLKPLTIGESSLEVVSSRIGLLLLNPQMKCHVLHSCFPVACGWFFCEIFLLLTLSTESISWFHVQHLFGSWIYEWMMDPWRNRKRKRKVYCDNEVQKAKFVSFISLPFSPHGFLNKPRIQTQPSRSSRITFILVVTPS